MHLKNIHETAQIIKGMHIPKATKYPKESLYRSGVGHSITTVVELIGVPGPNSGAGHRASGLKRVLNFCCAC